MIDKYYFHLYHFFGSKFHQKKKKLYFLHFFPCRDHCGFLHLSFSFPPTASLPLLPSPSHTPPNQPSHFLPTKVAKLKFCAKFSCPKIPQKIRKIIFFISKRFILFLKILFSTLNVFMLQIFF